MDFSFGELMRMVEDFDLEGFLRDHGFDQLNAHNGSEWLGPCPTCGKEKLAVDFEKRAWHCFVCQEYEESWDATDRRFKRRPVRGAGGLIALIELLEGCDAREAIDFIHDQVMSGDIRELAIPLPKREEPSGSRPAPMPEGARPIHAPLPYMLKRGITMEDVQQYGLFWCASGKYRNRIVFPVWEKGQLLYWQARAMYEKDALPSDMKFIKSLNPKAEPGMVVSSEVLMNIELASRYPRVCVVEGPMDLIRSGPDTVCTFGKQISPTQVDRLRAHGVTAIDLMWDSDASMEMVNAAPWLSTFFDVRVIFLPQPYDPGDLTREQLWAYRRAGIGSRSLGSLTVL